MDYGFSPGTPHVYDASALTPFLSTLPASEQEHSLIALHNLINLSGYVNDYGSSVALHTHVKDLRQSILETTKPDNLMLSKQLSLLKSWDEMAGREAAMTLFHFGKTLMHIKANMRFTVTLREQSLKELLRKASGDLDRSFPNYEVARHAAGHRAEAVASVDEVKKHAVPVEGGDEFIIGQIRGDEYVATFERKRLSVALTEEARQRLSDIAVLIYSAFPTLFPFLPSLMSSVPSPARGDPIPNSETQ